MSHQMGSVDIRQWLCVPLARQQGDIYGRCVKASSMDPELYCQDWTSLGAKSSPSCYERYFISLTCIALEGKDKHSQTF